MKYFIYLLVIIILLGINIGLFPYFKVFGAMPNLLLLFLVIFAMEKGNRDFFFISVCAGLFLDAYSGTFPGSFAFAFLFLGVAVHAAVNRLVAYELHARYVFVGVAASVVFVGFFVWSYNRLAFLLGLAPVDVSVRAIWPSALIEALYTMVFLYPIYWMVGFVKAKVADLYIKRHYVK